MWPEPQAARRDDSVNAHATWRAFTALACDARAVAVADEHAPRSARSVRRTSWVVRAAASLAAAALAVAVVPRTIAGRDADAWLDGDLETQRALADQVAAFVVRGREPSFDLGEARFEGEWALVTYQMAILGLGQLVLEHPELRARYVPAMETAAARMMRREQRDFATQAWGGDGLAHLDDARGEAWLGWPDLALSMLRLVHPETPLARENDRITAALARRLSRAPHALIETYPGASFPTDVAACVAAVALHARATGAERPAWLARWEREYRARWIDGATGYLWQQGDWRTGAHRDAPRGSGTAVGAYFLTFVSVALVRDLERALARHERSLLGFGAVREYAEGQEGTGDVDSGPVVLGVSIAATGFTLGAARAAGDRALFTRVMRTTHLFGVPAGRDGGTWFASGGPFGNAVLLAQLTARAP